MSTFTATAQEWGYLRLLLDWDLDQMRIQRRRLARENAERLPAPVVTRMDQAWHHRQALRERLTQALAEAAQAEAAQARAEAKAKAS